MMVVVEHAETASDAGDRRKNEIAELEAIDPATGEPFRDGLDLNDRDVYLTHFKPRRIVLAANFRPFDSPEHHILYTFLTEFVCSGVAVDPTIGWEGGIFDRLDD